MDLTEGPETESWLQEPAPQDCRFCWDPFEDRKGGRLRRLYCSRCRGSSHTICLERQRRQSGLYGGPYSCGHCQKPFTPETCAAARSGLLSVLMKYLEKSVIRCIPPEQLIAFNRLKAYGSAAHVLGEELLSHVPTTFFTITQPALPTLALATTRPYAQLPRWAYRPCRSRLRLLPPEIFAMVVELLPYRSKQALKVTCRTCRDRIGPIPGGYGMSLTELENAVLSYPLGEI